MKMQHTIEAVRMSIDAGLVPILWGPDGEGKTSWVRSEIKRRGWRGWILNGSNMDPTDVGGAISVEDGVASRIPVHRAIREAAECSAKQEHYIMFITELTSAPGAVLATLLTLMSEYIAGDVELDPEYIHIILDANPPDMAVNATDLPAPVNTRMVHFDWKSDFDFWCEGMMSGEWAPVEQAALVIGFLKRQGEVAEDSPGPQSVGGCFRVPPTREYANKPRPTPRTWTNLARGLDSAKKAEASHQAISLLVSGTVGQHIGSEFMGYYRLREHLPEPSEILARAETVEIPERADIAYMFFQSIAAYVSGTKKVDDWNNAWLILGRSDGTPHKDKAVVAAQTLATLYNTPEGHHLKKHIPNELRKFVSDFRNLGMLKAKDNG